MTLSHVPLYNTQKHFVVSGDYHRYHHHHHHHHQQQQQQ